MEAFFKTGIVFYTLLLCEECDFQVQNRNIINYCVDDVWVSNKSKYCIIHNNTRFTHYKINVKTPLMKYCL